MSEVEDGGRGQREEGRRGGEGKGGKGRKEVRRSGDNVELCPRKCT